MYYRNRAQAGRILANQLKRYSAQNTVVVALSRGSVILGAQIAMRLHTNLLLHLIKNIYLPGEPEAIAGLSSGGAFSYNHAFSTGELEELQNEFRQFIEQRKFDAFHDFNILLGKDGEIHKELLRHRVVILVSDGLANGMSLDVAREYLKTIATKRIIIATPVASVPAVDRMHLIADEIHCLCVADNFISINHYYDDNTLPSMDDAFKIMRNISYSWNRKD